MDGQEFDRVARQAAHLGTRRLLLLRGLTGMTLAAALGVAGARQADAGAGCFVRGKPCRHDSQCCTLNCRFGTCR